MLFRVLFISLVLISCNSNQSAEIVEEKAETVYEDFVEYHKNGMKMIEGKLKNGKRHGQWIAYYDNGFKWSVGKFIDGKRDGLSIIYYKNGRKKISGIYKSDYKVGIWKVWEEDGSFTDSININTMLSPADSLKLEIKR